LHCRNYALRNRQQTVRQTTSAAKDANDFLFLNADRPIVDDPPMQKLVTPCAVGDDDEF